MQRGKLASSLKKFNKIASQDGLSKAFSRAGNRVLRILKRKLCVIPRYYKDNLVHIAFYPPGGLGDYIISKKVLEEILENENCVVDVYCDKMHFSKAVYEETERVKLYAYEYNDFEIKRKNYDLALKVEHFIHILNMNKERLCAAPSLYRTVEYIQENWNILYVDIPEQYYRERIRFEKCRILGLDRWTELRMGSAFRIENKKVFIPLLSEFLNEYKKLGLEERKYITINHGADEMLEGKTQLKPWPKKNLEEFCALIKKQYPRLKIVQLGAAEEIQISGADLFIFGKSLELAKWILKNSLCHIDLEGGLVHLATQLGTKCIVCFGPTPVHMYGYEQNINIVSEFCSNCMGLIDQWAYNCSRNCDGLCMKKIESQKVFDAFANEFAKILERIK